MEILSFLIFLDLTDAFLQFDFDNAKRACVITAPLNLYRYNKMHFAVALSSAKFQSCINLLVGDVPGVAVYLNSLILTTWYRIRALGES